MAASSVSTGAETLRPANIDIPTINTKAAEEEGPLSPRSWRHRTLTYQPPSRVQTTGSLDAEDYFVCLLSSSPGGQLLLTNPDWPSRHVQTFQMAFLYAYARLSIAKDDHSSPDCHDVVYRYYLHIEIRYAPERKQFAAYCLGFRRRSRYLLPHKLCV